MGVLCYTNCVAWPACAIIILHRHPRQAFGLEIENKKVVRALVREVGEEVSLSKILDEGSDWKGRREQLITLRDQIKALKASQVGTQGACSRWACRVLAAVLWLFEKDKGKAPSNKANLNPERREAQTWTKRKVQTWPGAELLNCPVLGHGGHLMF